METLDDTVRRLKREREEADRQYNEALTSLDRAVPAPTAWPSPIQAVDDSRLAALNAEFATIATPSPAPGWRGRLAGFIWRTVAPSLERQLRFNSRLVDHLNRNAAASRLAHDRALESAALLREEFAKLAQFHGRTMQYLQQITAYVDTRNREAASGAVIMNRAFSGLVENMEKRWESLAVRDQRYDVRAAALDASHAELRTLLGVTQQATLSLKRELENALSGTPPVERTLPDPAQKTSPSNGDPFRTIDSYKYVGFEDQFRGAREVIRARLETYLPSFAGAHDVLDVGCGRGEFLELLAGAGIAARGIDLNHEMVELCRSRGLDVMETEAVGYLASLPDASLGGLIAAQVVEHFQPSYLLAFLELAFHKLRPGSHIVLETLNPACWVAFFDSYIRDITHVRPLHPETLKYLAVASGFSHAEIEYRAPVPPHDKLQTIALPPSASPAMADAVEIFNGNVEKLNSRIFTHLDYAVIGTR